MISEMHFWRVACDLHTSRTCHVQFVCGAGADRAEPEALANGWRKLEGEEHACPQCKGQNRKPRNENAGLQVVKS